MTQLITVAAVIDALALPPETRVDQRVPKKLLVEQGAPTAADKRQIQDGIEGFLWIAALKPTNIGVPAYRDEAHEYLEIAVLSVSFRSAKASRLIELIHRAVPYPVLLIATESDGISLSLGHKRFAQNEAGKVVVEDLRKTGPLGLGGTKSEETAFLATLALSSLPSRDMFALYQGWIDCVLALEAARITGAYVPPTTAGNSDAIHDALEAHARLTRELMLLRTQVEKEKQMNRRVELNLEIKRLGGELAAIANRLKVGGAQ